MSNVFKLLIISFLIIGCKTGYEVNKINTAGAPERAISKHSAKVTRDAAGSASAVSHTAKNLHK